MLFVCVVEIRLVRVLRCWREEGGRREEREEETDVDFLPVKFYKH
jgi:hypothetical protein